MITLTLSSQEKAVFETTPAEQIAEMFSLPFEEIPHVLIDEINRIANGIAISSPQYAFRVLYDALIHISALVVGADEGTEYCQLEETDDPRQQGFTLHYSRTTIEKSEEVFNDDEYEVPYTETFSVWLLSAINGVVAGGVIETQGQALPSEAQTTAYFIFPEGDLAPQESTLEKLALFMASPLPKDTIEIRDNIEETTNNIYEYKKPCN